MLIQKIVKTGVAAALLLASPMLNAQECDLRNSIAILGLTQDGDRFKGILQEEHCKIDWFSDEGARWEEEDITDPVPAPAAGWLLASGLLALLLTARRKQQ